MTEVTSNPGMAYSVVWQFGRSIAVPTSGTLQLFGVDSNAVGVRIMRACTVTGGSIQVNVQDNSRSYNLEIRKNGTAVATVSLASGTVGNSDTTFSAPFAAGNILTAYLVRTSGTGASTFTSMDVQVEATN